MAGRIKIEPYKPLGVSSQAVPGGGYLNIDASAGRFEPSPLLKLGLQAAEGAAGIAGAVSEQLAADNEAVVKSADLRLGEAEQALLFDPRNGFLNTQGQAALTKAPEVLGAYREAQDRALAETADDDQRGMLQGMNERRLASFTTVVEQHTAAERQRWYDEAGERRIAQMQTEARLHWSDDALLRRALGTTRFEVREKAKRKGWDATLTEAALRQHTSRTLVAAIEGAVERDPERAQALRARYDQNIEAADRLALDALLAEAQSRRRADAASAEILNATPPDGEPSPSQWRLRQAEAIAEPVVRAATVRRVLSADAEAQVHARALAEQVLARVLKDGLTDSAQIPVREWVTLDAAHRQTIETRLDHNAAGTEPAKNPALVDELATQMTRTPHEFARRDLVPEIAHLPQPQWQRFRDWQAGLRRNDLATEDQLYAIKRGLQLVTAMLPADIPDDSATNVRAGLVEDLARQRRIIGKSPDDADIRAMVERELPPAPLHNASFPITPRIDPPIHDIQWQRALKGADKEAATLFFAFLAALQAMLILQKPEQRLPSPSQDRQYPPPAPPPAGGWPSEKRTPAPDAPEVRRRPEPTEPPSPLPPTTLPPPVKPLPGFAPAPPVKALPGFTPPDPFPMPPGTIPVPVEPPIYKGPEIEPPRRPEIESIPRPEIERPPIYQSDDDSRREKMVGKPHQSGKDAADDVPSWAKGIARYVDETLDEYVDRIMTIGHGKDWKLHAEKGPRSDQNKIRKYGSRHWIPKPKR